MYSEGANKRNSVLAESYLGDNAVPDIVLGVTVKVEVHPSSRDSYIHLEVGKEERLVTRVSGDASGMVGEMVIIDNNAGTVTFWRRASSPFIIIR
jgi:hypothetical protein